MANVRASRSLPGQYQIAAAADKQPPADQADTHEALSAVFSQYDTNGDGVIDLGELSALVRRLFRTSTGDPIADGELLRLMQSLDSDKDGVLSKNEFLHAWLHCFRKAINPVTALVVVDVQHDFIDGSLALKSCPARQDGAEVVPVINTLLNSVPFNYVVYSLDWHPADHISFVDNVNRFRIIKAKSSQVSSRPKVYDKVTFDFNPPREQVLWPRHCVQGSPGAELHKDLVRRPDGITIRKGIKSDVDSYSAFWDNSKLSETGLNAELKKRNVSDVYVCGLAYDVCVGATAVDALEHGFRTVVIEDACRGTSHDGINAIRKKLPDLGAILISSDQVAKMVRGEICLFELGLFAARSMPKAESSASTQSPKASLPPTKDGSQK